MLKHYTNDYPPQDHEHIFNIFVTLPAGIASEYVRTVNPWYGCLLGHLDAIQSMGSHVKKYMGEAYDAFDQKVEDLKLEIHDFKKRFPGKKEGGYGELMDLVTKMEQLEGYF